MQTYMKNDRLRKLRNIGIIAHIDAGKTTTTEQILFHTGETHRLGSVDDGTTVTDFLPQERERGITIQSAVITCEWADHQINLIDTPGHIDFTAEVQRSLRVLDGGVVLFDGVAGVEPQSETVWRQADRYGVPRIAFVNKMDRVGASLERTVSMIRDRLSAHPISVQMPIGREASFQGVIDLIEMKAIFFKDHGSPEIKEIPSDLLPAVRRRREQMIEALADVDDDIALAYVEGEELDSDALVEALRRATIASEAVPVLCGSALHNQGIYLLLDAIVRFLPSPLNIDPITAYAPKQDEHVLCVPRDDAPLVAQVFKISRDRYMGKLSFVRVYSGVMRRGMTILNAATGQSERVGRLVRMHADRREQVEEIRAGDLGGLLGCKLATTGQTISTPERPLVLERISFPDPVLNISVATNGSGRDKFEAALRQLSEEDPTLSVRHNEETGETVLSGMGELHLEVVIDRLLREFGVDVSARAPRVAYRETISRKVCVEGRQVKQTGGHGQYAVVELELEPLAPGTGFVFEDAIRRGVVPKEFIRAVESGIVEAMKEGPLAKAPLVDIKATLVDGKYHETDSSDMAFRLAGASALREGVRRAGPLLLEPIMKLEVVAPLDYTGDVIRDLSSRAAKVTRIELTETGVQVITAQAPLARMFAYATSLRSVTHGRGTFMMEFSEYAPVSEEALQEVLQPSYP